MITYRLLAARDREFCVRVQHLSMRAYVEPLWGWNEERQNTLALEFLEHRNATHEIALVSESPLGERHVRVRDETGTKRVEFEVLQTSGEQGGIFDTSGNLADAALVNRARRFICVHKLTGTDAESLALLARQRPALLAQLLECGEDK